ncbi:MULTISPECIES: IS66 family insertion sequence element accessory protein TnpB [unclassified Rhizobium]|nr:IS66 family insertion sequence element accessory protein TnpB [Rhizobium sp. 16-488-2b]MBO9178441.1 IS66 family insertion sequence element accessory protein TnpB [Rhizobium sp. 16-488-2a]MBO9194986.1 IS66 family insertion sequence element accessory protein TnpB [Rhizobium sp. 16-449-1b]
MIAFVDRGRGDGHALRHEQPGAEGSARSGRDPHGGEVFCFRGRKGDLIKVLWHDGVGMALYLKRLEAGKFVWPVTRMAPPCRCRRRSSAESTSATRAGRNDLRRQTDRLHSSVFVGLSACAMVALGHG